MTKAAMPAVFFMLCFGAARAQNAPPAASCRPSPTPISVKPDAATAPAPAAGGIRIFLFDAEKKPVARKRFFLLRQSALAAPGIDWAAMPKRADYLQGASPQLREWLARHDCDSIYCPEFEAEFPEAVKTVPEFRRAYEDGLRKYRNAGLALKWMAVNFPLKNVRSEFFKRKRAWVEQAARKAGRVASFMTDDKGRAVFTGFPPGEYHISNLFPLAEGGPVWDCKVMALPPHPRQMWAVTYVLSPPARQSAASP